MKAMLLERLTARTEAIEKGFEKFEEHLPCDPMDDAMLDRMNSSLGLDKDRSYRPYCVRQGCELMPRMFRVREGFRCWCCNNVWDLTGKEGAESQSCLHGPKEIGERNGNRQYHTIHQSK